MADQIAPQPIYSSASDVNVLVARLGEQLLGMKESLARIERGLEMANTNKIATDKDIAEHKAFVEKQHLEHKADVDKGLSDADKRLSALETRLNGYRGALIWLGGAIGTVTVGLVINALRVLFHW